MQVLTFDFHNTLVNCDPWFDLEVRDLPWAVIQHLDLARGRLEKTAVDLAYRDLRLSVIESGNEIDAYDSIEQLFEQFSIAVDGRSIRTSVDQLMHTNLTAIEPVPGAAETVRFLQAACVPLGVVSSAVHHLTLEWVLDRLDLASCFETIVTSASSGFYKSTPAIYEYALGELNGDAATSVHVGDSLKWDVLSAQQAGLHAVWLQTARRDTFATGPHGVTPTLTLQSLEGAGPMLQALLERVKAPLNV